MPPRPHTRTHTRQSTRSTDAGTTPVGRPDDLTPVHRRTRIAREFLADTREEIAEVEREIEKQRARIEEQERYLAELRQAVELVAGWLGESAEPVEPAVVDLTADDPILPAMSISPTLVPPPEEDMRETVPATSAMPVVTANGRSAAIVRQTHADAIAAVLKQAGGRPLSLDEIVGQLAESGHPMPAGEKNRKDSIRLTLSVRPERFRKGSDGRWTLVGGRS